jgi:hypothetical protein
MSSLSHVVLLIFPESRMSSMANPCPMVTGKHAGL